MKNERESERNMCSVYVFAKKNPDKYKVDHLKTEICGRGILKRILKEQRVALASF